MTTQQIDSTLKGGGLNPQNTKTKVLVGAGVQTRDDIIIALRLGASGVLIGHAVPKAKDPKKFLERLLA